MMLCWVLFQKYRLAKYMPEVSEGMTLVLVLHCRLRLAPDGDI